MNAKIIKAGFSGCPDGQLHPRAFAVGDTVTGDLGGVAVDSGYAEAVAAGKRRAESAGPANKAPGKSRAAAAD